MENWKNEDGGGGGEEGGIYYGRCLPKKVSVPTSSHSLFSDYGEERDPFLLLMVRESLPLFPPPT